MAIKKSTSSNKVPIFAYLRRSTSKEEQAESLVQQEDGIWSIVKKLGFEKEDIVYFAETYSGFENKKRKQWGELIKAIDLLKTPCIIIARDISRLSRNPTDSQGIMDRLYGDNKKKKLIDKIYTLDYDNIKEWDRSTDKEDVHKALSAGYYDSLDTRRKSIGGILLKLEDGQFPYASPKGLSNFKTGTKRILKQNDKIPFIRRAFEMKTEGKTHKEISKYLMSHAQIRLSDRELTDRLFRNPIYIGEYIEKTTGKLFTKLSFVEGQPPISRTLWDRVQKVLGRKISQYGEKQEGHLMEAKIKSESGHIFSKYLAKQKYPTYKGKFKDASGNEEFIHISEKQILNSFIKVLGDILNGFNDKFFQVNKLPIVTASFETIGNNRGNMEDNNTSALEKGKEIILGAIDDVMSKHELESAGFEYYKQNNISLEELLKKGKKDKKMKGLEDDHIITKILTDKGRELFDVDVERKGYVFDEETGYDPIIPLSDSIQNTNQAISREASLKMISDVLKKQFNEDTEEFHDAKESQTKKLQKKKDEIEQERKNYRRDALKMGYSREEIDETTKDMDDAIKLIESQIMELSDNTDMEQYLEKLPEMLLKTVELVSNTINKANLEGLREDIKLLLEITTVELTISNKKELKVKLFDVLDRLLSDDFSILEAPSGVEPLSKALQASV